LELGHVPTTAEVKDEVKSLKAERKREREEVRHARHNGGAQAEEWRHKMEERQEEQSRKLDSLDTLLRQFINSQRNYMSSWTSIESAAAIPEPLQKHSAEKGKGRSGPSPVEVGATEGVGRNKNTNNKSTNSIKEEPDEAEERNEDQKCIGLDGSVKNSGSSAVVPLQVCQFIADL
jgi:hypothetical protein